MKDRVKIENLEEKLDMLCSQLENIKDKREYKKTLNIIRRYAEQYKQLTNQPYQRGKSYFKNEWCSSQDNMRVAMEKE